MNQPGRSALLFFAALFLIIFGRGISPDLFGPTVRAIPVEQLFPERVSLALRLSELELALDRHWQSRGVAPADKPISRLLAAFGPWQEWQEKYGEGGLEKRVGAYREAFFRLLGPDGWLVFGDWPSEDPQDLPETALILYLKEGGATRSAIPLIELLAPGNRLKTISYRGFDVQSYEAEESRDSVQLVRCGGWLCFSMRNPSSNALRQIIDRYIAAMNAEGGAGVEESASDFPLAAIHGYLRPPLLWKQLDRFNEERGRDSGESESAGLSGWARHLKGIDRIELAQVGNSLLQFDLTMSGARVEELLASLGEVEGASNNPPTTLPKEANPVPSYSRLPILEADFDRSFATEGLPALGLEWQEDFTESKEVRRIAPGLARLLRKVVEEKDGQAGSRFGLALYRNLEFPLPQASVWQDRPPLFRTSESPSSAWRTSGATGGVEPGDSYATTIPQNQESSDNDASASAESRFADGVWTEYEDFPLGYLVVHWAELARWMDAFPWALFSDDDLDRWRRIESITQGLDYAAGSVGIRIDRKQNQLVVRIRTHEIDRLE